MSQRQQTQIKGGLNQDYQVDPNAQYGSYQQMLQSQGSELHAGNEQAQQRGFFGPGLGNQGESALRYGQAVQSLGFKNSLADYESGYQAQMGDIERQKNDEMLASLQGAAGDAWGDWTDPGYDPQYDPNQVGNLGMTLPVGYQAPPLPVLRSIAPRGIDPKTGRPLRESGATPVKKVGKKPVFQGGR